MRTRTVRRLLVAAAMAASAVTCTAGAAATVPQTVTHQGRLFDANGAPLSTTVNVQFAVYDAPTGGTQLWTETYSLTLDEGYYSVELGSMTPFGAGVFDGATRYFGVTVGTDPEMSPRTPMVGVPYALVAGDAIGDIHPTTVTVNGQLVIDSNGNWVGNPTGLQGPQGAVGPQGPQGVAGATGPQGSAGTNGALGPTGPTGAIGPQGPQGVAGATGPAGTNGTNGALGPTGPTGAAGTNGAAGTDGAVGATGAVGPTGPAGSGGGGASVAALTDGASIAVNAASANVFTLTLTGNHAVSNATSLTNGQLYTFRILQDSVGGHTLSWGSSYFFNGATTSSPSLGSTANALTGFLFFSDGTNLYQYGEYSGGCTHGSQVLSYTGAAQAFTVGLNGACTAITAKLWAAGGGSLTGTQGYAQGYTSQGGGGGYSTGIIAAAAGQTLEIVVGGGGGAASTAATYGGGGAGSEFGGAGGGRSAILLSDELITAGGGGGGGSAQFAAYTNNINGGAGGGAAAQGGFSSTYPTCPGYGATSTAVGAGGTASGANGDAGSGNTGGSVAYASGAGGGGYFGGGSGGYVSGTVVCGGGGGSGYIGGVTSGATTAGAATTPANDTDPSYVTGIGIGGSAGASGGNGMVVLTW